MLSLNYLPHNSELECEQYHEYSLNRLPSASQKSWWWSPLVQTSELFLLLLPGSLRQSSCECLQLHQICPSKIHGETGLILHTSWKKTAPPGWWRAQSFQSFDSHSQLDFHTKFRLLTGVLVILPRNAVTPSLWRAIMVVAVTCIRKSKYSQWSCEWPELNFHLLWLDLPRQLVASLHIANCWRSCCHWSTSGEFVATLKLCPTLRHVYVPEGFCTLYALQECSKDLLSYFVLLKSPPVPQWPFLGKPQCTVQIVERVGSAR